MKWAVIVLFFIVGANVAFGQGKYDANWCFGHYAGINFSDTSNPTTFVSVCNNIEACASISDSEGRLLFYLASGSNVTFDASTIRDSNDNTIIYGDTILINPNATQGCMIIPFKVGYYTLQVYSTSGNDPNYHFLFSKIEVNSGVLQVTVKNRSLTNEIIEEKLAAVRHANGRDWWIIVHQANNSSVNICNDSFLLFLATPDTILGPYFQNIGSQHCSASDTYGQMIFSKDGSKLIENLWADQKVDMFSFDRCTGTLSDFHSLQLPDSIFPYGCALNASNNLLYVSTGFANEAIFLYQLQLNSSDSIIGHTLLFSDPHQTVSIGQLKLAPNNKIYLCGLDSRDVDSNVFHNQHLGVINEPDSLGTVCNFQPFNFYLGDSARTYWGLPNTANYNLGPLNNFWRSTVSKDTFICKTDTTTTGVPLVVDTAPGVSFVWQPGPGIDSIYNTYQVVYPPLSMWYYVTFTDTSTQGSCNSRTDSVYVEIRNCDTTGINTLQQSLIKVYPNPANDKLIIELPVTHETIFTLYDILGQSVIQLSLKDSRTAVDVSALPQGLYTYRVNDVVGKIQVVR